MQSYDLYMLMIVVATTLWGLWKGFAWQLASVTSVFSSYGLAYSLRAPVAKMIDADPPWNMFAAMLIIYVLMSIVSWVGFGLIAEMINGLKLKDFDRQLGGLLGAAKGALVCVIVTFFAVTLAGPAQQQNICESRTGRYITVALRNSGGLIPPEIHAVVDPYLTTLQQKLEQHPGEHPSELATNQPSPTPSPVDLAVQAAGEYAREYLPQYVARQYEDPRYADPRYDPRYDPRSIDPRYSDARYTDPRYADPRYADPRYSEPQYSDPRYSDPRYANPPSYDPRYSDPRTAYPNTYDPRYDDPRYQPNYAQPVAPPAYNNSPYNAPYQQPYNQEAAPDPRYQRR